MSIERNIEEDKRYHLDDVRPVPIITSEVTGNIGVFGQAEVELRRAGYKPGEIVMILVSDTLAENDPSKFVKNTGDILNQNYQQ